MPLPEGIEWSLHSLALLAAIDHGDASLTAAKLAEFHGVTPTYLAKSLQQLAGAGIIDATRGRRGGYRLAKPAKAISVLDVVEALDGVGPSFRCSEIRQRGPSRASPGAYPKVCGIAAVMFRADAAWRAELRATTVADLARCMSERAPAAALAKGTAWLRQTLKADQKGAVK